MSRKKERKIERKREREREKERESKNNGEVSVYAHNLETFNELEPPKWRLIGRHVNNNQTRVAGIILNLLWVGGHQSCVWQKK